MKRASLILAVALAGCGTTKYVATPVDFGNPKPPYECKFPDDAAKDLKSLSMPAGDVTLLSLAAGNATTHRENRYLYRSMRQAFIVCSRYVGRLKVATGS